MRRSWSVLLFSLSFIILTAASMPGDLTWAEATEEAPQAAVEMAGMSTSTEIQVGVDGELTAFDPPARLIDNRLMTPLRATAEALNAQVE
ncbi:MAG: hypothetical protein K0R75_999 [Paenibacillaceae bacterium]|jgi:hypothetical protein|nr:hypothetical protein [Paenibacillaceae bacterium]